MHSLLQNTKIEMTTIQLSTLADLSALESSIEEKYVLFFWAQWHEPSKVGGHMQEVYSALAQKYSAIKFALVEAEMCPEISEKLGVTMVPTFFTCIGPKIMSKLEGATPSTLSKIVKELDGSDTSAVVTEAAEKKKQEKEQLFQLLERLVRKAPVMLFMKGSPAQPRCGFSRQMVEILQNAAIPFSSFDILTDDKVRQGLKEYGDWPTFPQLYVEGTLVGGLDIVKEMAQSGDLKEQLGVKDIQITPPVPPRPLVERLKELINRAPVMLFMKGTPDLPRCGFSSKIVGILREAQIEFDSFNILSDEEIRQGLKDFSEWPTYPQLYVKGALIGGLDIVNEMVEAGNFKEQLGL